MKAVFKGATVSALQRQPEVQKYYERLCKQGMRSEMAQLTVARKLAAMVLILWKKGERYDSQRLNQAAPGTDPAVKVS
jgi:hypothetical protein